MAEANRRTRICGSDATCPLLGKLDAMQRRSAHEASSERCTSNENVNELTENTGSEILTHTKQEGTGIMASIITERNGRRTIQLSEGEHTKRPKIRLGKVTKREAESVRSHIEGILRAKRTGSAFSSATADWIAKLPSADRKRLEKLGLIDRVDAADCPTLADWVEDYVASRKDVKAATATVYGHTKRNLTEFFDADTRLDEVTPGDADEFRINLEIEEGLSDNTVRRRMGIAKQFFRAAVRKKLITENPFAGQATVVRENTKRNYFVTRDDIDLILEICPDPGWRLVFALARYGGLRCASEIVRLKWSDINWGLGRFTVHSSKTEHHADGGVRVVPMFPELAPYLRDAYDAAEPGEVYCCPQYTNANQMYRKVLLDLITKAGLKPWAKLFQNCRSSRETELAEKYPIQVVCAWIGNSPQVAAKHYLQVTEGHFARATEKAVRNPVQHTAADERTEAQGEKGEKRKVNACGAVRKSAALRVNEEPQPLGPTGLEPVTSCVSSRRSSQLS